MEVSDATFRAQLKKPISRGQSVVAATPAPAPGKQPPQAARPNTSYMPFDLSQNAYYCHYCRWALAS